MKKNNIDLRFAWYEDEPTLSHLLAPTPLPPRGSLGERASTRADP